MALFGTKKKTEETKSGNSQVVPVQVNAPVSAASLAHVLKNPRITEKASMHQGSSVYTFDVATSATKTQIAAAIRSVYSVSPRKVRIVQIPSKQTRSTRTGKRGVKTGGKKAYVYLKNGETITIA